MGSLLASSIASGRKGRIKVNKGIRPGCRNITLRNYSNGSVLPTELRTELTGVEVVAALCAALCSGFGVEGLRLKGFEV